MWIVAGLGNPGREYEWTRHNVGFRVTDLLAARHGIALSRTFRHSVYGTGRVGDTTVCLLKPTTYMNRSGFALAEALAWWKVEHSQLLVVLDEANLLLGSIRIRPGGSAGSHNGLVSVVEQLGTTNFPRLRLGIGASGMEQMDLADFVLGRFRPEEEAAVETMIGTAADAVECCVQQGVETAMARFNRRSSVTGAPEQ